jgi:hypothetical protein
VGLLLFSVLPIMATIFLLNQELQIIPLDYYLQHTRLPGSGAFHAPYDRA